MREEQRDEGEIVARSEQEATTNRHDPWLSVILSCRAILFLNLSPLDTWHPSPFTRSDKAAAEIISMLLRAHNTDLLSIQDLLQRASLAEVFSSLQRAASRGRGADPLLQGSSSRGTITCTHRTRTGFTPCGPSSMSCRRLRAPGLDIHGSPPSPSTQSSLNRIPAALKRKVEGEGEE